MSIGRGGGLCCFQKKWYLFYVEAISILLNGEINALHFLASMSPLNPVGSFLFPSPPLPLIILFVSLFSL